jgi:hypothetical protein
MDFGASLKNPWPLVFGMWLVSAHVCAGIQHVLRAKQIACTGPILLLHRAITYLQLGRTECLCQAFQLQFTTPE